MPDVKTFGEVLSDLLFEQVLSPDTPDRFLLHSWDGHRISTTERLELGTIAYVPKQLPPGLAQSVRLPLPSKAFNTTPKLVASAREFLSHYAELEPEVIDVMIAFAFATWVCDCMSIAPVLSLVGPKPM